MSAPPDSTAARRNSNTQLLEELEALSQSLYQSHTSRRTASLALPRSSVDPPAASHLNVSEKSRSRRISLSPWRSRPKLDDAAPADDPRAAPSRGHEKNLSAAAAPAHEKKGIWSWKPLRALSHIGMQRVGVLFSVEVIAVQGLPASMNGLRLSVNVRKKETKEGAVQTMPARVLQGAADFEETLFIKCHLYCSVSASGSGKQQQQQQLKFEPRPFLIYVAAVDAAELSFGQSMVDLSRLVQESMEKNWEGTRIRQWDTSFNLSGKAKGGELVLKLGFQIMEDKGVGIYSQSSGNGSRLNRAGESSSSSSSSAVFARKQSKSSFSVTSPRISSRLDASSPSKAATAAAELQGIDDFNLDEPGPVPSTSAQKPEPEAKVEDLDLPEFEVVDKGVEIQGERGAGERESEEVVDDERSVSSEVVKEVVHDPVHQMRLTELDEIAQQIKALESMIGSEEAIKTEHELEFQGLDAEEETVTREFLQMLEEEEGREGKIDLSDSPPLKLEGVEEAGEAELKAYVSDLGKGLGSVVRTRDGGYLAAMNPFDVEVSRKEMPKLAMQISKPLILPLMKSASGFEAFQRMAAVGIEELSSEVLSAVGMDELMGKTAEQIAFEGIASAIIHGRNKEGATSSAARSIATVKTMVTAMSAGRRERISMGIWNVSEKPVTVEEILAFSLQKIETMAVEALKIQAEMAEEEAPFDISPLVGKTSTAGTKDPDHPLAVTISLEDWAKNGCMSTTEEGDNPPGTPKSITLLVVVQMRDPLRRYEAVGAPVIVMVQATHVDAASGEDEEKFKVASLHMGGLKVRVGGKHVWDTEKQRLTAMQWLVAYGLGKVVSKKGKPAQAKGQDSLWSISSRVMADMWLKPIRNPDVKLPKQTLEVK
ncbi:protein PLASTID MOVEMENT IMPAIRED 1 isoform X2 [Magnolia sinica]|uniref:protein PLASTID MOVEMENT IMPAIRED 1 isoform X2 n=1 Tax=Magnolia sinica TaxID=86752 RepID=UPI00265A030E|nr:protein PLASTID MOVEMENT IMPAIRED 1 isoform X2 [Magnolia sinica]